MGEVSAEHLINATVGSGVAAGEMLARMEERARMLEAEERAKVQKYIAGIRPAISGVLVQALPSGVGGQYDGSGVAIARTTLLVGANIEETVAQAELTRAHENYHKLHHHTDPMQVVAETRHGIVVTIGGKGFTDEALVEGLTVMQTGDRFVSAEYVGFQNDLMGAMASAGLSVREVEDAVNVQKDLTLIDDATHDLVSAPVLAV